MRHPQIFMFSGQGSQYYHMGYELYNHDPIFKHWMSELDNIVFKQSGISVINEIYNKNKTMADNLDAIMYTHPAIFMVEYSLAQVLLYYNIEPDYLLGVSLGEYTGLALSGVLSAKDILLCLIKQAELVKEYCTPGKMTAIMQTPDLYYNNSILYQNTELAGINYNSHFVISGDQDKVTMIEKQLSENNIEFVTLPIHYSFHAANIDPIKDEYMEFLNSFTFKKPEIPLISCSLKGFVTDINADYIYNISRVPIYFQETLLKLTRSSNIHYIDLGPSGTLANFVKYNLEDVTSNHYHSIITPFKSEMEQLDAIRNKLSISDPYLIPEINNMRFYGTPEPVQHM